LTKFIFEKLVSVQLLKKLYTCYWTQRFILASQDSATIEEMGFDTRQ